MLRRCWVEVSTQTLVSNLEVYRRFLSRGQEVMAVVKADAYGHGDVPVSLALQRAGVRNFAVSNVEEAVCLRRAGVEGQILILGYTPPENWRDLLAYDITQALLSEEYADLLAGHGIKAQFAVDTGMRRIGLDGEDAPACGQVIRKFGADFVLTGLFTHLCVADTPAEHVFTEQQIGKFRAVAEQVADLHLPYVHCLNSAGGLWHNSYGNLVRLGIVLYGLKPDYVNVLPKGIRPVLTWKSVVSMIKTVPAGATIGYGRTYQAKQSMRLATVSAGYADGLNRGLSNKGLVRIRGQQVPIVGRVCMDQFMADVSSVPEADVGDEVILLDGQYTADDMARAAGTIGYEVLCNISKRVSRVYVD